MHGPLTDGSRVALATGVIGSGLTEDHPAQSRFIDRKPPRALVLGPIPTKTSRVGFGQTRIQDDCGSHDGIRSSTSATARVKLRPFPGRTAIRVGNHPFIVADVDRTHDAGSDDFDRGNRSIEVLADEH
jgi:hypothetical protein